MGTARRRAGLLLAAIAFTTAACGSDSGTSTTQESVGDVVEVTIADFAFDPSSLSLKVGDVVRWTNDQSVTHTVTSNDDLWDATVASGDMFEHTIDESGIFPYFCAIHPSMTATLEVSG